MRSWGSSIGAALQVMWATFLRDMFTAASYRIGLLLSIGGSLVTIFVVFFLGRAFGGEPAPDLARYGGSYFGFAVVGVALSNLMALGLTGMSSRIREGQVMGTLELMLLSPNRLGLLFVSSSLWAHAQALVTVLLFVVAGIALGADFGNANVGMTLVSLVLAVVAFNAFGLFSAAVVIVIKQGNPVALLMSTASVLLAGVFYPVTVLPDWLRLIGQLLPLTQALELVRRAALVGEGLDTLWTQVIVLLALTSLLIPIGLWVCAKAVEIAQTDGSLSQY